MLGADVRVRLKAFDGLLVDAVTEQVLDLREERALADGDQTWDSDSMSWPRVVTVE